MKTYTICHRHFGYITHSYLVADRLEIAEEMANEKYSNVMSVMLLNK